MENQKTIQDCRELVFDDIQLFREKFGNVSMDEVMLSIEKQHKEMPMLEVFINKFANEYRKEFQNESFIDMLFLQYENAKNELQKNKDDISQICRLLHEHVEELSLAEDCSMLGKKEPSIKDYRIAISTEEEVYGLNAYKQDVEQYIKSKEEKHKKVIDFFDSMNEIGEHEKYQTL